MSNSATLQQLRAGQLIGIKRLQLAEGLKVFPPEIFTLADSLEILDLSDNQLNDLPDDLPRLVNLKILFLSNNCFEHIPGVLQHCPKLEMIGFKANKISQVAEGCLPVNTRWLILTDNQISRLPNSMGQLSRLQKLALAGNKLAELPSSMALCRSLELVRLSANSLSALPDWLLQLPRLAWLAFAGNPFSSKNYTDSPMRTVNFADLELAEQLGEGASGFIYKARWLNQPLALSGLSKEVAVKLFKGNVTSDGYPEDELKCCLTAGEHSNLIKVVAQVNEPGKMALVMELIPSDFYNLGLPPSLQTCTRDTFEPVTQFSLEILMKVIGNMAKALHHLHSNQVSHGDVYAHNTMLNQQAELLFGDFGAASHLANLPVLQQEAMQAVEVRAFGCLLEDMLIHTKATNHADQALIETLVELKEDCMQSNLSLRPKFAELITTLENISSKIAELPSH
ncbi:leucine-rich repeat-containing serine/threonine-protein kinase [Agarivorans sp. TSD2052]|nr:leucine-rich repeat-containing protein kinase family protein [Agarivorans sp. TSD2052]UPW17879.1 leucine-rich repeat-containing serine/threonine-protein kinase [Agarivorans sp. TSD2052]